MASIKTTALLLLGAFGVGASAASHDSLDRLVADSIQLTEHDVGDFSAIAFGDRTAAVSQRRQQQQQRCSIFPGDDLWPPETEWTRLNRSLDGVLLRPTPAGAVCYPDHPAYDAAQCQFLLQDARSTRFWLDDPLTELAQWTQGTTCPAIASQTQGEMKNCTRGGFPEYVVNATTAKHVQIAVNFARNKGIRLVIKNTGHDFGGRSVGAGSLSVWVHHMIETQYIPSYTTGSGDGKESYTGMAVRLGTGIEAWEVSNFAAAHGGITVVAPGGNTVGGVGGWVGGGGHSVVSSTFGLGADQVLLLGVVTADGCYVTADPFTNPDLFFALRGGGGATYGIIISAVHKAHPPVSLTTTSLRLTLSSSSSPSVPAAGTFVVRNADAFWTGVGLYYRFCGTVIEDGHGGQGFSYIYPDAGGGFRFTTTSTFLNRTRDEVSQIMQPLYASLRSAGVLATADADPATGNPSVYGASRRSGTGDQPVKTRQVGTTYLYRSRLLPRTNWQDDARWNATMAAIRAATEAGYDEDFYFHGTLVSPTRKAAGWPGADNAVSPAWRENLMHAVSVDFYLLQCSWTSNPQPHPRPSPRPRRPNAASHGPLARRLARSRFLPERGDPGEPGWQQAFFGSNYERLLEVKKTWDPWQLFWAPTTVGSEGRAVGAVDGYPNSQNGRLCRSEA
ncbi:fad binding domain-containing protein [Apiospora saccharicola]|uniref:Fad binding domain-containing protein n=1 Tax=Apiospora saccharicola TaxID=335842 RepID=A0ABR1WGU1_9PEZI